ncbi:MAG: thrombospondin type 3 repeat-containing protein [Patescibacteria group bacterium]|nr:thrombospondin type 3 repeat-containing protein [Patescibacteria group bacterium]MDD5554479.1 thrombospondin type 3 repeat-containing protein [Patescibacteria group bacterium]
MFNKKTKIIILGIIILFLLVILIFILKIQDKKIENNIVVKNNENTLTEKEIPKSLLTEMEEKYPEFTSEQIKFYTETAAKENLEPCEDRADKENCVSAVAFLTERHDFCSHGFEEIGDEQKKIECVNEILNKTAEAEIDECLSVKIVDLKIDCFSGIFGAYEKPEDCSGLKVEETKKMCEDNVYYRMSIWQGDKKLCDNIKEEYLKNYCNGDLVNKKTDSDSNSDIDSDNDGLTDKDEAVYGTDPKKADTDGDGYSDGDEVKNGYNPLGEGRLK